jgi:hypothetical protein
MMDDDPLEARAEQLAARILGLMDANNPGLLLYASTIAVAILIRRLAHDQAHANEGVNATAIDLSDRVNELFGPQHSAGHA